MINMISMLLIIINNILIPLKLMRVRVVLAERAPAITSAPSSPIEFPLLINEKMKMRLKKKKEEKMKRNTW